MRWFAMSTRALSDPKVEQLGEKHGPAGPLVWVSLLCEAGLQEKGGAVERTYRKVAHETFSDAETARAVVDSAVDLGLCHAMSRDVVGFKIEIPKWQTWQATGRKAKERAEKKSEQKPHEQANVTRSHTESHDVALTVQDNTKQKNNSSSARAREADPVLTILCDVAFYRSLTDPEVPAAAEITEHFGSLASEAEAKKFRHYYTEGPGKTRPLSDVVWAWRRWLEQVKAPALAEQPRPTDRSAYARIEAAE